MDQGTYEISWSPLATEQYLSILYYLTTEWSSKIADSFVLSTQEKILTLQSHPFIGAASEKDKNIRSISLSKHNRLYYQITETIIEMLAIFDTRQNPEKNIY